LPDGFMLFELLDESAEDVPVDSLGVNVVRI
jgi:hypothetical protein